MLDAPLLLLRSITSVIAIYIFSVIFGQLVEAATLLDLLCKVLLVKPSLGLGATDQRPDTLAGLINRDPGDRYTPGEYKCQVQQF